MNPTVCCVMLVNGREQMVKRALSSFHAQTYERKHLLIYDTSDYTIIDLQEDLEMTLDEDLITMLESREINHHGNRKTIGYLRNRANAASRDFDLIAHWDSDDWSHSRRLEEQVALLESSGKQCVGYRELLFWDTRQREDAPGGYRYNEAWLYRNPDPRWAAGASFLYRRELWEQQPFDDAPHEDQRWWCTPLVSRNCVGISSVDPTKVEEYQCGGAIMRDAWGDTAPRMICQIHAGSTENIPRQVMLDGGGVWNRASGFDAYCAEKMQCA